MNLRLARRAMSASGPQSVDQRDVVENGDTDHGAEGSNFRCIEVGIESADEIGFARDCRSQNRHVGRIPNRKIVAYVSGYDYASMFEKLDIFVNLLFREAE